MGKKVSSIQVDAAVFSQLREENAALKQEVEELRRKLEQMNEQLGMFNEAETEQDHKAPEPTEETLTVKEYTRERKPKRTMDELTEGLPVKEIVLELAEEQQTCSACGQRLKRIGKKFLY